MNTSQALYVARKTLEKLADRDFFDYDDEVRFEKEHGVSHAQIVNALPIIAALETVEDARS